MSTTTILAINIAGLWIVLAILAAAVLALYHHFGVIYSNSREGRESQGPAIGSDFQLGRLTTVAGQEILTPTPGRRTAILFASTYCSICAAVFNQWNALAERNQSPYEVVVLCAGDGLTSVRSWAATAPKDFSVVFDSRRKRSAAAGVSTTPFLVLVDENGIVFEKGLLSSGEQLVRALTPPRDDGEAGRIHTERAGAMA